VHYNGISKPYVNFSIKMYLNILSILVVILTKHFKTHNLIIVIIERFNMLK